jgi:hypothetical protein
MLSQLARQLGVALLATSLLAAPVLGAMPRCCQTGALAGGGNCCCGPQTESEERPACCQSAERSCCAKAAPVEEAPVEEAAVVESPAAGNAPCSCKTINQQPAIVTGKDRIETHQKHQKISCVHAIVPFGRSASQLSVAAGWDPSQSELPGISRHKVYCRWTV